MARRPPGRSAWEVYPRYELPAVEFLAQLYLYLRDREEHMLLTGNLTSVDAPTHRVF